MKGVLKFALNFPSRYKGIFSIILAYALFAVGGALYWAAIPLLAEANFQLNAFNVSLIVAIIGFVYVLTDELIGVFFDLIGYKKGAIISLFFAMITALISILNPTLGWFIVGIIFFALAWNGLTIATSAYVLFNAKKHEEGKVFGAYGVLYKIGSFTSTLFIGYILSWQISVIGMFFLFLILLSLLLIAIFLEPEKRKFDHSVFHAFNEYRKAPFQFKRGWEAMKEFSPVSWVYAINGFIASIFGSVLWLAIPLSLANLSPSFGGGAVLSVYELGGIFFFGISGFLSDKVSRKKLFLLFLFILFLISIILGFVSGLAVVLILVFLLAALIDATATPIDAMMAQVDKKHNKDGTIFGFIGIFTDSAFIIGPILGGLAFVAFGFRGVFIFLGIIILINWIVSVLLLKNFNDKKYAVVRVHRRHIVHFGGLTHHGKRFSPEKNQSQK